MKKIFLVSTLIIVCISCMQQNSTTIPAEKFQEEIAKPDVILLDVRTKEEYDAGHLINSINIDYYGENFATQIDSLDKTKQYELYCRSGKRSGATVELMQKKGFKNVHHLEGGILEWMRKDLPVTK